MKKKVILRALLGAPISLTISTFITMFISAIIGDGQFYAVAPGLEAECGGELNAVLLQAACSLLYGAAWAGASVIWENDRWSLLRQTVTHLVVCSVSTLPIAWFMHWIPRNAVGLLAYLAVFLGIYGIIWLTKYLNMKKRIQQMNKKINN